MSAPSRIQLRRTKGWRLPEGAINVARPTRWGNPYLVGSPGMGYHGMVRGEGAGFYDADDIRWADQEMPVPCNCLTAVQAVALYRHDLVDSLASGDPAYDELRSAIDELRGHDLACWCSLDEPCHANVLVELANLGRGWAS